MRILGFLGILAMLSGFAPPPLHAKTTAAPKNSSAAPAESITLGSSAATLPGPWKFAPGDSPVVNGKLLWAEPGFDDSEWVPMDLAPETGSIDPSYGTPHLPALYRPPSGP